MQSVLRKDLEYVLPKLTPEEQQDPESVLNAIFALIPERKAPGGYTLREVEAALNELRQERPN